MTQSGHRYAGARDRLRSFLIQVDRVECEVAKTDIQLPTLLSAKDVAANAERIGILELDGAAERLSRSGRASTLLRADYATHSRRQHLAVELIIALAAYYARCVWHSRPCADCAFVLKRAIASKNHGQGVARATHCAPHIQPSALDALGHGAPTAEKSAPSGDRNQQDKFSHISPKPPFDEPFPLIGRH